MSELASVQKLAERWLERDQDPSTRKEIEDLLQANDEAQLERRLRNPIAFGTAGLRSAMKAGFAHMNPLTVLQASQGLAQYILDQHQLSGSTSEQLSIVIGHDARHNSERFARLSAGAFLAKGIRVLWFEKLVHTPMVPFAVSKYKAAAGVMVTASHNPKNDNGYKVYWSNGCQIIPPHDAGIAKCIGEVGQILSWRDDCVDDSPFVSLIFAEATEAYYKSIQALPSHLPPVEQVMPFTYTAMHGVGLPFMQHVVHMLSFHGETMRVVQEQADPNPEFPTVPFPNPEEKGALDLAMKEAERNGSEIIISNDPDADRFAVAEKLKGGTWHQFTGNQMGVLLGSYVFDSHSGDKKKLAMLASTVSSRMLSSMAAKEGFHFRETLTGFKWLGNVAQNLTAEGFDAAYAYEEAIGYMFPTVVWDKDGIAAAVVFLKAWQSWAKQGLTPWQKLQQLFETYGYFEDANTYLISPSPEITQAVFTTIRTLNHGCPPTTVGSRTILRWRDLTIGFDSRDPDRKPDLPVDPTAQMLTCELGGVDSLPDVVFTARGSGTEPKIKLYIEGTAGSSAEAKVKAREVLDDLLREWFGPEFGLRLAGT